MLKFLFNLLPFGLIVKMLKNSSIRPIPLETKTGVFNLYITKYCGIALYPDVSRKEKLKERFNEANAELNAVMDEINQLSLEDIREIQLQRQKED